MQRVEKYSCICHDLCIGYFLQFMFLVCIHELKRTSRSKRCAIERAFPTVCLSVTRVSRAVSKDKISFIHIDKRDDQPNSITANTTNSQMNRTTTYVGPKNK